jgi:hypothetical protein
VGLGLSLPGIVGSTPAKGKYVCLPCCVVRLRSLHRDITLQNSSIECGVSECDRQASIRTPLPTRGYCAIEEEESCLHNNHNLLHHITRHNTADRLTSSPYSPGTPQIFISLVRVFAFSSLPTMNIFPFYTTQNSTSDLLRIAKQTKISTVID